MEKGNFYLAFSTAVKTIFIAAGVIFALICSGTLGCFVNCFIIPLTFALLIGFNKIKYLIFPLLTVVGSSVWLAATNNVLLYVVNIFNFDIKFVNFFINIAVYIVIIAFGVIAGFLIKLCFKHKEKILLNFIAGVAAAIIIALPAIYQFSELYLMFAC